MADRLFANKPIDTRTFQQFDPSMVQAYRQLLPAWQAAQGMTPDVAGTAAAFMGSKPDQQAVLERVRQAVTDPMATAIHYRGLKTPHDPNYPNTLEWYSPQPELANQYAGYDYGANVITKNLPDDIGEKAFNPGFRTAFTEIKAGDFIERIQRGITDAFQSGKIDKETGIGLMSEVKSLELPTGYKRVYDWWNDTPEFSKILKKSGYDAIHNVEQGLDTYGIIK